MRRVGQKEVDRCCVVWVSQGVVGYVYRGQWNYQKGRSRFSFLWKFRIDSFDQGIGSF